jgi:hypothetical protein
MGFRRYRGPVTTVEQAMFADMPVAIQCQSCSHVRRMHAFTLMRTNKKAAKMPLGPPVAGFYCKGCRKRVSVIISAPMQWA